MSALLLCVLLTPAELEAPVPPGAALVELRGAELSAGYAFALGDAADAPLRLLVTGRYELRARVAQPRVGVELQPWTWLALRVDAGPMLGALPLDLGASARALATFAARPGPVLLYAGPVLDVGGHLTSARAVRTRAYLTSGVGLKIGPLTTLLVADLGYTFAARDTGALLATAGIALQWSR